MRNLVSALALAALLFPGIASALDFTASGTILTVTYTEPTTNADTPATLLDDLAFTNVYYQLDAGVAVKGPNVPATSPAGGGAISTQITVPVVAGQRVNVTISATATDTSGNESVKSTPVTKRIDRLAPTAPK